MYLSVVIEKKAPFILIQKIHIYDTIILEMNLKKKAIEKIKYLFATRCSKILNINKLKLVSVFIQTPK